MKTDPTQSQALSSVEADLRNQQLAKLRTIEVSNTGEALRRKIRRQVDAWRHNRVRYPGWLVAPTANRRTLWAFTEDWVDPILAQAKGVEPVERLRWLRELTWRYDLCLLPLFPSYADVTASTLAAIEPFRSGSVSTRVDQTPSLSPGESPDVPAADSPLRPTSDNLATHDWAELAEDWLALACSILRFHREQANDVEFEALATRLETLPPQDPERLSFVTHQRCLRAMERLDHDVARQLLAEWKEQGSDPFWMIRKASLMAELADRNCEDLAKRGLDAVRDLLSKSAARGDDLYALSREGWAIYAVRAITRHPGSRGLDFRPRLETLAALRCDPAAVIEPLATMLETRPTIEMATAHRPGTGTPSLALQAHQARRLLEDSGYPLRFGNIVAGAKLLQDAMSWISVDSDRDGLPLLFRTDDTTFIKKHLSRNRVARLMQVDAERTARLAITALVSASPQISRAVPRRPGEFKPHDNHDALRTDAANDQARTASSVLEMLAPRLSDEALDTICTRIIEIRTQWLNGDWQVWGALGSALSAALEEMLPEHAGRYLMNVISLPLVGLDVKLGSGVKWHEDPITALWSTKPVRASGDGPWRTQIERLLRALDRSVPQIARAQAMLRLVVLDRTGALLSGERASLAELVWSQSADEVFGDLESNSVTYNENKPVSLVEFPLPLHFLLELTEPRQGDIGAALRSAILSRPLPRFSIPSSDGHPPSWSYGPSKGTDPLHDVLAATGRPWRTDNDRNIEWKADDVAVLLENIEGWWSLEGPSLWRMIQEDRGPFNSMLPRWRFSSIVEIIAYVILPARIQDRAHLARASDLIRRMREEGIPVDLALPVLVANDPSASVEVARALRLALSSTDLAKANAAPLAIFVWLYASDRSIVADPPDDLLQEIFSIVRIRRRPALSVALQLATIVLNNLRREGREITSVFREDVSIGLQYLAEETRYDRFKGTVDAMSKDDVLLRQYAVDLLAAYAPHVSAEDEALRLWVSQADDEPMRYIRRVLIAIRDDVAGRASGSPPP